MGNWVQDVVVSYVGGIALGAPVGLLAVWVTHSEGALTAAIVCAMAGVLVVRRKHRRRPEVPVSV